MTDFCSVRPYTHEQMKYRLFAQILTILLHTDPKLAQIKFTLFAHVYAALTCFQSDDAWLSESTDGQICHFFFLPP